MLEFMKAMKPAQEARFKGGAKDSDSRARVAKDCEAQMALIGKPKAAREFRWFSVEADQAKLSFRYGRRVIKRDNVAVYDLPAAKLKEVMEGFKASVLKGEWDEQIAQAKEGLGRKKDGTPRAAKTPKGKAPEAKPAGDKAADKPAA